MLLKINSHCNHQHQLNHARGVRGGGGGVYTVYSRAPSTPKPQLLIWD